MSCEGSANISFEFRNDEDETYLKIRPRSMQFDRERGKFDYCQAEFSQEVADEIQPHLDDEHSFLRQPLPVVLLIEDVEVYRLLWVPDGVTFGEDSVHIEFHDPQKYLTRGVIDWKVTNTKLRDAYEYVFNHRNTDGPQIFNDIRFTEPEESYDEIWNRVNEGTAFLEPVDDAIEEFVQDQQGDEIGDLGTLVGDEWLRKLEEENTYSIAEGHFKLDFDKISPWECITQMNEKFGLRTWAAPDGNLWVGSRKATGIGHVATTDDKRVWKLSDYQVTAPRDPVVKSVVRGGWTEDPSEDWAENAGQMINNLNLGTKDFRVEAVAETEGGSFLGQETFDELVDAKRDELEEISKRKMMNKQRQQQSGYLELRPDLSGDSFSEIRHATIGDSILTIPPEDDSDPSSMCETNIEKEIFDIVGVQHELDDSGDWNLRLDVMKQLDGDLHPSNIDTRLRYYDPHEKEYIEGEKYSTMVEEDNEDFFPDFI